MSNKAKPFERTIDVSTDDRGTFVQFLENTNRLKEKKGLAIKRVYYVYDYGKGIIRGFHLHQHEWKYFIVVAGAGKIVALNQNRPKEQYSFISSSRKPNLVVIPPGYAHGWMSLEDRTILVCGSTSTLKESLKDDQRFDPHKWGDLWTIKGR